ncbi:monovalent cation/H(+) antiporter subunit G [Ferroglobus sp.]|uniref:monovalent cation/H(+) antiporter subunit G n=1 Tax=Ferroglobus sp. TaxID=2614230 RepID=UPI0025B9766C|nr:monovalent cation/H(+) antiporter subunit G [Ferroglobus sp.]
MEALHVISAIFMFAGCFFMISGAIGIIRFPDFYTRLHAAGKCDTLGEVLIILGFMIYQGLSFLTIKLFFLSFFILLANPVGTHALIKAAYVTGVKMWRREENG